MFPTCRTAGAPKRKAWHSLIVATLSIMRIEMRKND
jgi:hypothetical protein